MITGGPTGYLRQAPWPQGGNADDPIRSRSRSTGAREPEAGGLYGEPVPEAILRRRHGARGPGFVGDDRSAPGGASVGPAAEPLVFHAGVQGDRADDHPGGEP